jgi:ABC-2 type transport system permease protein
MSPARTWNAYLGDIRFEFLKSLRTPAFAVPTLFFPIMFYGLFGILFGSLSGNGKLAQYTFATYGVFGAMGPGLFGFGVSLAIEREQGLLTLKQALPQPPGSYLFARAAMAMLFVAIISLLLLVLALFVAHVPLTFMQAVKIFAINVLGTLPFCAIGLAVGSWVSGQAAPAIVNLIFLPMAFLSGLWVPLQLMPKFLTDIAPVWPAFHLAQMSLDTVGGDSAGTTGTHIAALAGITVLFFWLAMRRLNRGGMRMLGESRTNIAVPLRRVATALVLWGSVGLVVAGVIGGNTKIDKDAAETAATSNSATDAQGNPAASPAANAAPLGVAAPQAGLIADFDSGTATARYGIGFVDTADSMQGGSSHAAIKVVAGGAEASASSLEISGAIGPGSMYPWAGAMFFPNGPPMTGTMNYSGKSALTFQARGDGKRYVVMIFAGNEQIPSTYPFEAGSEWREVRVPLADYVTDVKRVRGIGIVSNGPEGEFRLQVDSINMR